MRVAIHQPNFLPWAGFWNKFMMADTFVVLTGVQFERGGYQNRVKVDQSWATLPVVGSGDYPKIKDARIADMRAPGRVAKTLRQRYARSPCRHRVDRVLDVLDRVSNDNLMLLNVDLINAMRESFGLKHVDLEIDMKVRSGTVGENLTDVLRSAGATYYLAGADTPKYLARNALGVKRVMLQRVYPDLTYTGTALDVLANITDPSQFIERVAAWEEWA